HCERASYPTAGHNQRILIIATAAMTRKTILIVAGSATLLAVAAGALYLRRNGSQASASETGARIDSIAQGTADGSSAESAFPSDVAIPVEGAPVVQDTMVISVTAKGEAAAWRQAVVSSLVAGELRQLGAGENAPVAQAAMLAMIDPAQYQLALTEAEAGLRQAEAQFREITLFDDRITIPAERAERDKAARIKSGLESALIRVERAKFELSRTQLNAPFPGRVASVKVVPGQWVTQGSELMTLVDISRIRVEVQVLESEIGLITPGRSARVYFAAFPDQVFNGRIETINPMVDKARFSKVIVALPNPGGRILPGMYARVSLDARRLPDRIMVPRSAIIERDRRKLVFVFKEGEGSRGLAEWRYVTTGAENETMVEIVENPETFMVKPGEIVLTGGHHTLTHDARIRIVQNVAGEEGARAR
ncbi:MAG: efflux RND transporter periplasmic adaptor subunit, partial [Longimicrobiales bacterium]